MVIPPPRDDRQYNQTAQILKLLQQGSAWTEDRIVAWYSAVAAQVAAEIRNHPNRLRPEFNSWVLGSGAQLREQIDSPAGAPLIDEELFFSLV
jgi:hypothetical protein